MVTPAGKRKAVVHLREAFWMSERRACNTNGLEVRTFRFRIPFRLALGA